MIKASNRSGPGRRAADQKLLRSCECAEGIGLDAWVLRLVQDPRARSTADQCALFQYEGDAVGRHGREAHLVGDTTM